MAEELLWTGERFLPEVEGDVCVEHMHRYYLALKMARGKKVLDIACGEGYGSNLLSENADQVIGVDLSTDAITHAGQAYQKNNLSFIQGNCTAIPLKDNSVDLVISFETIEHHDRHQAFVDEIRRVLRPDGFLLISSPDKMEYSDLTGHKNQYHVKELYYTEFERLLTRTFSQTTMMGQRIKYGSWITPLEKSSPASFTTYKVDHNGYAHEEPTIYNPMYFLCIAGETKPPQAVFSLYEHPVEDCDLARRVSQALEALSQRHSSLTDRHQELTREAERLKGTVHHLSSHLEAVLNSSSWKMTRPVRQLKRMSTRLAVASKKVKDRGYAGLRYLLPLQWGKRGLSMIRESGGFKKFVGKTVVHMAKIRNFQDLKNLISKMTPPQKRMVSTVPGQAVSVFEHNFALNNTSGDHVPFKSYPPLDTDLRLIAFYLPQFHPIPENDRAWGRGFTEWTNVSKATPQFDGHYQPRLPGELGFYDLRLPQVQKRQIELAKNYGLKGFCYHYYWFDGKKVMDTPLNNLLSDPDMNFPFCINWANENWTKRWDGLDQDVILAQNHTPEDDFAFIQAVEPILKDPRYIKIDHKPLLMIYRPSLFPDIQKTADRWRGYARDAGIGDLYLVCSHAHEHLDPTTIGFDAACEFAPNTFQVDDISDQVAFFNPDHKGSVLDYQSAINYSIAADTPDYKKFRSLCPAWDNEARKPGKGIIFHNSSPESYHRWLEHLLYQAQEAKSPQEKIIFINAWNEWAEGAVLEPDKRYGYAYLDHTYRCLKKFDAPLQNRLKQTQNINKTSDTAVIVHLYYTELWDEIRANLASFGDRKFDLFININNGCSLIEIDLILKDYPGAHIYSFENRGRDILPFLRIFDLIFPLDFKHVCKIHSKKSLHREDGDYWRESLIGGLIGSPETIDDNIEALENNAKCGMVVPRGNILNYRDWIGSNNTMVKTFAADNTIKIPGNFPFPSGSMFWFKPVVFKQLYKNIDPRQFKVENGQLDGTMAHTLERLFGLLCHANGYQMEESRSFLNTFTYKEPQPCSKQ